MSAVRATYSMEIMTHYQCPNTSPSTQKPGPSMYPNHPPKHKMPVPSVSPPSYHATRGQNNYSSGQHGSSPYQPWGENIMPSALPTYQGAPYPSYNPQYVLTTHHMIHPQRPQYMPSTHHMTYPQPMPQTPQYFPPSHPMAYPHTIPQRPQYSPPFPHHTISPQTRTQRPQHFQSTPHCVTCCHTVAETKVCAIKSFSTSTEQYSKYQRMRESIMLESKASQGSEKRSGEASESDNSDEIFEGDNNNISQKLNKDNNSHNISDEASESNSLILEKSEGKNENMPQEIKAMKGPNERNEVNCPLESNAPTSESPLKSQGLNEENSNQSRSDKASESDSLMDEKSVGKNRNVPQGMKDINKPNEMNGENCWLESHGSTSDSPSKPQDLNKGNNNNSVKEETSESNSLVDKKFEGKNENMPPAYPSPYHAIMEQNNYFSGQHGSSPYQPWRENIMPSTLSTYQGAPYPSYNPQYVLTTHHMIHPQRPQYMPSTHHMTYPQPMPQMSQYFPPSHPMAYRHTIPQGPQYSPPFPHHMSSPQTGTQRPQHFQSTPHCMTCSLESHGSTSESPPKPKELNEDKNSSNISEETSESNCSVNENFEGRNENILLEGKATKGPDELNEEKCSLESHAPTSESPAKSDCTSNKTSRKKKKKKRKSTSDIKDKCSHVSNEVSPISDVSQDMVNEKEHLWLKEEKSFLAQCEAVITEVHCSMGKLQTQSGTEYYFLPALCFLYGVSLAHLELWHVLFEGQQVKVTLDLNTPVLPKVTQVTVEDENPKHDPEATVLNLQKWCSINCVPEKATMTLIQQVRALH